jgi:hypothetical protein
MSQSMEIEMGEVRFERTAPPSRDEVVVFRRRFQDRPTVYAAVTGLAAANPNFRIVVDNVSNTQATITLRSPDDPMPHVIVQWIALGR